MALITLPTAVGANGCDWEIVSFNIHARPATGAAVQPIYRPGSRFALNISYPPMYADDARKITSRLIRAERAGMQIDVPLLGVSQGSPGAPVVNGANPSGTSLPLRGCTPGYVFEEGYWLTLVNAAGDYFLHRVVGSVAVNGSGLATLSIETPIRAPFADGTTVLAAAPKVQGFIENGSLSLGSALPGKLVGGIAFRIEEYE